MADRVTRDDLQGTVDVLTDAGRRLADLMASIRTSPLMACCECGHAVRESQMDESYSRLILKGRLTGPWGDCYPDEYESVCPECGAKDSFDEVTD